MTPINSGPHIRDRVAELEDENAELRSLLGLGADVEAWRVMGFTPTEARMINLLLARDVATRDQLLFVCHPDDPDRRYDTTGNVVSVHLARIRRKLKPLGAAVGCLWGSGWRMTAQDKDRLRRAGKPPCRAAAE